MARVGAGTPEYLAADPSARRVPAAGEGIDQCRSSLDQQRSSSVSTIATPSRPLTLAPELTN